jgi:Transposase
MRGTMTWVGMDVHARSTHGAAISSLTGELSRVRFGPGVEPVVEWLGGLEGPVRAVYEAGPTGFGLARAAQRAGVQVMIAAPSKTPRATGDRVKSDRKDAELLARLLFAGQLRPAWVPPEWLESVRHLARMREAVPSPSRTPPTATAPPSRATAAAPPPEPTTAAPRSDRRRADRHLPLARLVHLRCERAGHPAFSPSSAQSSHISAVTGFRLHAGGAARTREATPAGAALYGHEDRERSRLAPAHQAGVSSRAEAATAAQRLGFVL